MQKCCTDHGVRRAKVNREIKGACHSATGLNNSRPVVVAVEADVVRWNIDWCRRRRVEGVNLVVGPIRRFGVEGGRLNDVGA